MRGLHAHVPRDSAAVMRVCLEAKSAARLM